MVGFQRMRAAPVQPVRDKSLMVAQFIQGGRIQLRAVHDGAVVMGDGQRLQKMNQAGPMLEVCAFGEVVKTSAYRMVFIHLLQNQGVIAFRARPDFVSVGCYQMQFELEAGLGCALLLKPLI